MTSKERVLATINHKQPDKVAIDIGTCNTTGINAAALYRLREYLGLPEKEIPIYEIMQLLGTVDDDVRRALGGDVIGLNNPSDVMGVRAHKEDMIQKFTMQDGTPVLIASGEKVSVDDRGRTYLYPQGDDTCEASMMMPEGGYFFDDINRAPEYDEDDLDARRDFKDYFSVYSDEEARYLENESKKLAASDYAVVGLFGKGAIGDSSMIPGPWEKHPTGIRSFEDWNVAQSLYPEYIEEVAEMYTENTIENLKIYKEAVGDNIQIIVISGTDFGSQNSLLMSPDMFRELYKPYFKRMNDWVHQNTNWKTWFHSCGAVYPLMQDFTEAGIDILNPLQLSAVGMDARKIKDEFGDKLVFWGGGVDTQHLLPNGTPDEIKKQVTERLDILAPGGGYVFNSIHNIMGNVPAENIAAAFEAARAYCFK